MKQRLINWLRGTAFVKRLVHLDDLKYHASRTKALYEHFYNPNRPHRVDTNRVNHWKERHNEFVKQYNEEKYWWMSRLKVM